VNRSDGPSLVARRRRERIAVWVVGLFVAVAAIGVGWAATPYHDARGSVAAVEADAGVTVERTDVGGYVIEPTGASSETGLVFYPGARVHPDAYVGSLAPLAREAGVTVVVPKLPLNLAVVDYGLATTGLRSHAAERAMATHDDVASWYVGGHSLGGAMACRYAAGSEDVAGLVLYGSYCDVDVSDRADLAVLSVAGEADGVLDWAAYEDSLANLPGSARVAVLPGVNHTQFGTYVGQDAPSGTTFETAHERLNAVAVPWFQNQTGTVRLARAGPAG
jgi:pimeloyl-ACP methyl ester carboxylesterase